MVNNKNRSYHFISGMPRSGTTLLSYILNKNEEVICLPEAKHVRELLLVKAGKKNFEQVVKPYEGLKEEVRAGLYSIKVNEIRKLYKQYTDRPLNELSFEIGKQFVFDGRSNDALKTVIDKNPGYTFILDRLGEHLPESKMLLLTRDYRAFCLSRMQKRNYTNKIFRYTYIAYRWYEYSKHVQSLQAKYPHRVKVVKYEELVGDDRAKKIEEICTFFGIRFFTGMMETEDKKLDEKVNLDSLSERRSTKLTDLSKPINKSRIDSWKQDLSESKIKQLEVICGEEGEKLGYSGITNPNGFYRFWVKLSTLPYQLLNSFLIRRMKRKFQV